MSHSPRTVLPGLPNPSVPKVSWNLATHSGRSSPTNSVSPTRIRRQGIREHLGNAIKKSQEGRRLGLPGLAGWDWTAAVATLDGLELEPAGLVVGEPTSEPAPEGRWERVDPLRKWRLALAQRLDVPAYYIAWNCHLEEFGTRLPTSLPEFARVPQLEPAQADPFLPSRQNVGLVEAIPPGIFLWEFRHPRAEITLHWTCFATLWMSLLEAVVQPHSTCEQRVLDFLPAWERGELVDFHCLWEEALLRYCHRIFHQRKGQ